MNDGLFILLSGVYVLSLATIDGMFNRLVFRKKRKLSYFSRHKQPIYRLWEWKVIGVVLLIGLPIVIPVLVTFALGGWKYVLLYLATLLIIPWDILFGRIVFDDWLGDVPSIALPKIGWIHLPLSQVMLIRFVGLVATIALLIRL